MSIFYSIKQVARGLLLAGMFVNTPLFACTGIKLAAKDGALVHGRTLEFGIKIDTSIIVVPRDYEFKATTSKGPGLTYKAKYAAVGAMAFDNVSIMDGINEKGLSVGTFYFPGFAKYATITADNQSKSLSPIDFSNWLITQFATVDEMKAGLSQVVIDPTVFKEWGDSAPPFHYVVYDKSGKSVVIEPLQGLLFVSDNPLGVCTNAPNFDWHMTNLRNFINLTPFNTKALNIKGLELAPLSQGSGMVGLPGDFTSPSRFVQAAIFSITATPSETADEAVLQTFHILNQFDIPVGIAREKEGDVIHTDYTMITCVRDPQALKFYFKTYDDQTIRMVDLNKFDLKGKTILRTSIVGRQPVEDVTSSLK